MHEEYQKFLHSSSTSTPTVIRPRVEVDPTGSTLCYDFQNWCGGEVVDLSPNGNNGTSSGFVDVTRDGAGFNNPTGIIRAACSINTKHITLSYLLKKDALSGTHRLTTMPELCQIGFANGLLFVHLYVLGASDSSIISTGVGLVAGEEFLLDITIDTTLSSDNVVVSVNGVMKATGTCVNTKDKFLTPSTLGVGYISLTQFFDGSCKWSIIDLRVRSESEIATRYNEIASKVDLQVMGSNLLPDETVKTVGMAVTI